jgi:hypothetical protein
LPMSRNERNRMANMVGIKNQPLAAEVRLHPQMLLRRAQGSARRFSRQLG